MKITAFIFALLISASLYSQRQTENLIIITTDGLRWQEVFQGMDSSIANNSQFNQGDSQYIYEQYWDNHTSDRRKKLLPFLWSTMLAEGQLFGNRDAGSKMDVANRYWFSYPGYSEIMTGYADTAINSNSYPANPHVTVLEYLNKQPALKGKVAAFGAWNAFDRILNEKRSGIPVVNGFDTVKGNKLSSRQLLINKMVRDSYRPWGEDECLDVFTHHAAMEYLQVNKPRVLYISYGETDEWAHSGQYRSYLDAAHQVDKWISDIWKFVQTDPRYKNKTTLLITTDHGRGDLVKSEWTTHGSEIAGASQIWLAGIGPDAPARGELKSDIQLYQQQLAQTFAKIMGYTFKADHSIANEILFFFKMKK